MASAATTLHWTVEEYLRTPFRRDVGFVDGQVEERNLGDFDRGTLILQQERGPDFEPTAAILSAWP